MENQRILKIEKLLNKGVKIPNPDSVEIGDDVITERISGDGVFKTLWVVVNCAMAVVAFAAANIGFLRRALRIWERGLLLAVAIGMANHLMVYRLTFFIIGIGVFILLLSPQRITESETSID